MKATRKMLLRALTVCLLLSITTSVTDAACNKTCVEAADCNGDVCECRGNASGSWGDGSFRCYNENQTAAEIKADTTLTTFNGEAVRFYFPCRYLLTYVRTELKVQGKVIGNCTTVAFGFNAKYDGKIFAHGLDVSMKISYHNGLVKKLSTRSWGTACEGVSKYDHRGKNNVSNPDLPWTEDDNDDINYNDTANGVSVTRKVDDFDVLKVEAEQCGFVGAFTAFDVCLRINQTKVPGISLAVDRTHNPIWLLYNKVLGLPPKSMVGGQRLEEIQYPGLERDESMLRRAMEFNVVQNQPQPNSECNAGQFSACNTKIKNEKSSRACFWMLQYPEFMKCVCGKGLSNSQEVLKLFNLCISAACKEHAGKCTALQGSIQNTTASCQLGEESLTGFLQMSCPL